MVITTAAAALAVRTQVSQTTTLADAEFDPRVK
jgi:hypothetical protein